MKIINKNFTLIGMPGVGKSTIGKKLAKKLGYNFIDLDKEIKTKENKSLQNLLSQLGNNGLVKLEEKEAIKLSNLKKVVISPGGSIVYSKKAMDSLKKHSSIIFLYASLKKIKKRIKNLEQRGIVGLEKGLDRLYKERNKLYQKYADIIINTENLDLNNIIELIDKIAQSRTISTSRID